MKTLKIDTKITDFSGNPITDPQGNSMTCKDILIQCVGAFFTSKDAKENITAYKIGKKLHEAEESVNLEDAEFDLINKAVKKTLEDQRYSVVIMGQICEFLESVKGD